MLYDIDKYTTRNSLSEGFWDSFTGRNVFEDFALSNRRRSGVPAVNVIENDDKYIIEMASPGMCKDDYNLSVEKDMLTISGESKSQYEDEHYSKREFNYSSFSRSFLLPEDVLTEKIAARCADGILTIDLPRNSEANQPKKREIKIS